LTGLPIGTLSRLSVTDGVATGGSSGALRRQLAEKATTASAATHNEIETRLRIEEFIPAYRGTRSANGTAVVRATAIC
jgi:hypothetical protein